MRRKGSTRCRLLSFVTALSFPILVMTAGCGGTASGDRGLVAGRIVYYTDRDGNWEVYSMEADGSGRVNLTQNPATDMLAAASYDGSRIAFTSDRSGNNQLYRMNADGSGQTRMMTNTAREEGPNWYWSNFMAFSSNRAGGTMHIWTMLPDGTDPKQITTGASDNVEPCLGSQHIVFRSTRDGNNEIYKVEIVGILRPLTRLTNHPASDVEPRLSPDGLKVLFSSNRSGEYHIYSMNTDGSGVTQLTKTGAPNRMPIVSIDSQRVAFTSERHTPGRGSEVYVMNMDGTGETRITNTSHWNVATSWPGK